MESYNNSTYKNSTAKHQDKVLNIQRKFNSRQKPFQRDFKDDEIQQLRAQVQKLKKLVKETQSKRNQITKQCTSLTKSMEEVESENYKHLQKLKQMTEKNEQERYRVDELKFLNKQLATEMDQLRRENQEINEKLHYSSEILQRKYEQLQQKTYKRIEQAMKRIKKGLHYLSSLTPKQIQKTKQLLTENLAKSLQLLRGKYNVDNYEDQIQELMNPIKSLQEELHQKNKEIQRFKEDNIKLEEQVKKSKKIEKQLLPQYKDAIEKLKKNLGNVRSQLAQNQYDRNMMKKKYEEKVKQTQGKYNQLFKQFRKLQLQKKIYENKLEEMEDDVQQEKQRLMEQNQMLKQLYNNQDEQSNIQDFKPLSQFGNKKHSYRFLKKNMSSNQLKSSKIKKYNNTDSLHDSKSRSRKRLQISGANQQSSMLSQQSLKDEIFKIDREIVEIQGVLAKELEMYK